MSTLNISVTVGQRGVITIPKEIREKYHLEEGDTLSVHDLGGSLLLKPGRSEIDELADRIGKKFKPGAGDLSSVLSMARESREKYGKRNPRIR